MTGGCTSTAEWIALVVLSVLAAAAIAVMGFALWTAHVAERRSTREEP